MKLKVKAGYYEANSLFQIAILMLKHRTWHLFKHGKWID